MQDLHGKASPVAGFCVRPASPALKTRPAAHLLSGRGGLGVLEESTLCRLFQATPLPRELVYKEERGYPVHTARPAYAAVATTNEVL